MVGLMGFGNNIGKLRSTGLALIPVAKTLFPATLKNGLQNKLSTKKYSARRRFTIPFTKKMHENNLQNIPFKKTIRKETGYKISLKGKGNPACEVAVGTKNLLGGFDLLEWSCAS